MYGAVRRNDKTLEFNKIMTKEIDIMVNRIAEKFHPEKVVLFGSHARGSAMADSDIDLLIVMSELKNRRKTTIEMRKILADIPVPKDIIVTSEEEIVKNNFSCNSIFHIALEDGKIIYDKKRRNI